MNWEYVKLGSVCKTGAGGTPLKSKKEYYENGYIPWLRSGEVNNRYINNCEIKITTEGLNNSSAKLFPSGTVLIAMYGATAGQVGILNFSCSTNQAVCGILPNKYFQPEFLYYFFLSFKDKLISQAVGNAQPNISQAKIKDTLVPSISIEEQQQIVQILDEAFAKIDQAIANLTQNLQNAEELFQSKLNQIFSQQGEVWEERKLEELVIYDKKKYEKNNKPYVGLENVESNTGKYLGDQSPTNVKSSTFKFDERHLLYGRLRPYLNKVLLPDFKGHCSTEIFPILPNQNIKRQFLFYWFLSPKIVSKINKTSTGARMPRANMKEVLKFKISVPSIDEQNEIIIRLEEFKSRVEVINSINKTKLQNLEELKKSLLEKAFSGELIKTKILCQ